MISESGGRWVAEVTRTHLWSMLRALDQAGHTLIEIKPALSLETAFLHVVKGD
jgi:ABC-2 type transport system ATP-binding protein